MPATFAALDSFLGKQSFSFLEILIVNDGSSDSTAALVESHAKTHPYYRLLNNPGNRGKGYSVRHGMLQARGDWVLFTDADLSAPIEEWRKLADAAKGKDATVAIGSRALDPSLVGVHQPVFRESMGRCFNLVMRLCTGLPFADTQCGFKLYRRDAAREIFSRQSLDGFSFDVENLMIAHLLGYKVVEVPVRWNDVQGTKVGMLHGARSFGDLLRIRWNQINGHYTRG